ncbi:MAG: tetratricopeptide repeat protein [Candidatus Thorarchaeota archaeon]
MTSIGDIIDKAKELRTEGKLVEAEELLRTTLDSHPAESFLWHQLGHVLLAKSEHDDAEAAFLKTTQLAPDYFWSWMSLGFTRKEKGDLEGAINVTVTAQTLSKTNQEQCLSAYNLGCYMTLQGRRDEAMKYLRVAIEGDAAIKEWAQQDDDLLSLHEDDEFIKLVLS